MEQTARIKRRGAPVPARGADSVTIRGVRLELEGLVDRSMLTPAGIRKLREAMGAARPYPHLVIDGLFRPELLDLVREEFDLAGEATWQLVRTNHEKTRRSRAGAVFGPASAVYFGIVNSGWFVDVLGALAGVDDLIADPKLYNGGLHETRSGGSFDVHRDFDRHVRHGFHNAMAFITYLNRDWDEAWGGSLELWETEPRRCTREIAPQLGRSLLLRHGPATFHGYSRPIAAPPGQVRRSVASYYYVHDASERDRALRRPSEFLFPDWFDGVKRGAQRFLPPIVWDALKGLARR
jgi:hypothetical protein